MTPPVLTDEQRARARTAALAARRDRADVRRGLRSGRIRAAEVLHSTDATVRRMRVRDLLESLPGLGPRRTADILDTVGIAPTRRIQGLTPRQRDALVALLTQRSTRGVERPT